MQQVLLLLATVAVVIIGCTSIVSSDRIPPEATMVSDGEMPALAGSMEVDGKPVRPRLFQSTDQIKNYLDNLGKFYTYHNRNRFGKRTVSEPYNFQDQYERQPVQEYEVRSFG